MGTIRIELDIEDPDTYIYNTRCIHCDTIIYKLSMEAYHYIAGIQLHFICISCSSEYKKLKKNLKKLK
jgi:hypothetical protein